MTSLGAGTRLGPYEVTALLGEGGMGKVWRAHHTALKRDDALKVLPEAFASDPDRLARFRREAQVLASLNHPNIAHVYGLEQSDGVQALVMELVEGPTLADRIARGPIPVDEALPIAKQIAEALETAHEQNIIHRDLKPANIKVRPDGTVKVLDFGLAKAMEPMTAAGIDATASPTITSPAMMTGVGVLLGTAAYMSPEQARGKAVDKRTDIWAFGAVVYEMVTGRRAFAGDDVSEVLASVLAREPDWTLLPPSLSPMLTAFLKRCLHKDRRQRIGDAQSLRLAMEGAFESGPSHQTAREPAPQWQRVPLLAVAALLAGALLASTYWMRSRTAPQPPVVTRFTIPLPEGKTLSATARLNLAISPDGTRIVYASEDRLFSRRLGDFDAVEIRGTESRPTNVNVPLEGINSPAFSPAGRSVVFFSPADNTLKRVDLEDGSLVTLCSVDVPFGLTWDASGILIGQGAKGIFRCPAAGGSLEQLAKVGEGEEAYGPQILPGTDLLLFTLVSTRDGVDRWDRAHIVVESLSSRVRTTIIERGSDARYVGSGHLVYGLGGTIFAAPLNPQQPSRVGEPRPVIQGVQRTLNGTTGVVHFAISPNGTLLYVPGPAGATFTKERAVAAASRDGVAERLPLPNGPYVHVRASRDGRFLAIGSDDGKEAVVSIFPLDGTSALRRLTFTGNNRFPVWSPDGMRVAFQSDREGDLGIFTQRADGTGTSERLTQAEKDEAHAPESWSPDGKTLLFTVRQGETYSLWSASIADRKVQSLGDVRSEFGQPLDPVFSPDGRWVAYRITNRTAAAGVYIQPFPPTGARYQAPRVNADFHPTWTPDGNSLVYVPSAASGRLAIVRVTKQSGVTFGVPSMAPAVVTGRALSGSPRVYDILPDGRLVGLVIPADDTGTTFVGVGGQIRVVLNWTEELKRLVPTN